jgi:hypothetical protein
MPISHWIPNETRQFARHAEADGGSIVYWQFINGVASVMVVTTSGEATPTLVRENVTGALPEWSPDALPAATADPRNLCDLLDLRC